jgi:MYXO-CTERM domain-containing protein
MKRTLFALACMLVAAASAQAKGITAATICGASECREVGDPMELQDLEAGNRPARAPGTPSPWYGVEYTVEHDGQADSWFVAVMPAAGYVRYGPDEGPYDWMELAPNAALRYRELTAGIEGRPARSLRGRLGEPVKARVDSVWRAPREEAEEDSTAAGPLVAGGLGAAGMLALGGLALRRRRG